MKPFAMPLSLIKMIIAPIIFCTIVVGIAGMEDMKKVGKTGGYAAMLYFEVVSTIAPIIGPIVVERLGAGQRYESRPEHARHQGHRPVRRPGQDAVDHRFPINIIPTSVVDAFAKGDMPQVLFFSIPFGYALACLRRARQAGVRTDRETSHVLFGIVGVIMKVAPIGAFGAMAFTPSASTASAAWSSWPT